MLSILLKKQMAEIFRSYFYDAKKNKARSKAATAAYIVLFMTIMIGLLGGIFTFLSLSICGALSAAGMDWLYFAIMGLLAILLGVFGSVFNTYSSLYLSKDNDLLLSAYIFSFMWNIKGGLMYKITNGSPRYVFKQFQADRILPNDAEPKQLVSGIEIMRMFTSCEKKYGEPIFTQGGDE